MLSLSALSLCTNALRPSDARLTRTALELAQNLTALLYNTGASPGVTQLGGQSPCGTNKHVVRSACADDVACAAGYRMCEPVACFVPSSGVLFNPSTSLPLPGGSTQVLFETDSSINWSVLYIFSFEPTRRNLKSRRRFQSSRAIRVFMASATAVAEVPISDQDVVTIQRDWQAREFVEIVRLNIAQVFASVSPCSCS